MGKVLDDSAVTRYRANGFIDPIRIFSVDEARAMRARLEAFVRIAARLHGRCGKCRAGAPVALGAGGVLREVKEVSAVNGPLPASTLSDGRIRVLCNLSRQRRTTRTAVSATRRNEK